MSDWRTHAWTREVFNYGGVEGGPELGQKDNLEFAKEEGVVGEGGLSQLGSACAKVSCLAGKVEPKPGASQG